MARYEINNMPGETDFECNSDLVKRIVQNAKNLIMLRMGEIPFDRQRGLDERLTDLPIDEMQEQLLPELDRVMLWEPDADVVSAKAELLENGTVKITCIIEIAEDL